MLLETQLATIVFREKGIVSCPPPRFGKGKNTYIFEIKQKFSAAPAALKTALLNSCSPPV